VVPAPEPEGGGSERRDAPGPGPAPAREEIGGMVLDQAGWDELVAEGLSLGITGFADQANGPRLAAILHRQVLRKRKAPAGADREGEGRPGKMAKEADLAALADAVELHAKSNKGRYAQMVADLATRLEAQEKARGVQDAHQAGQVRMAVATQDWKSPILRGQYDGLVPLMQVALEAGDEKVVAKIQEHMDILMVANRVPNGPELMQRVLEDRKDDRLKVTEKLFDAARQREVKEAKNMKALGFQDPYASPYAPFSPSLAAAQMPPPAPLRGGAASRYSFWGSGGGAAA
jgi:hypothetical protein